eukprot:358692-Chlamydomonas_euryale.AAC.1
MSSSHVSRPKLPPRPFAIPSPAAAAHDEPAPRPPHPRSRPCLPPVAAVPPPVSELSETVVAAARARAPWRQSIANGEEAFAQLQAAFQPEGIKHSWPKTGFARCAALAAPQRP